MIRGLLTHIDAAIDGAGPARAIEPVGGTADPASLCVAAEIEPLLAFVGASGAPTVEADVRFPGATTCTWGGNSDSGGTQVEVLPGGAWAIPRLQTGVASIFMPTHPSADGSFVIGMGDGVSAWRAVGDDLVHFISGNFDARDGWEAFIESTW